MMRGECACLCTRMWRILTHFVVNAGYGDIVPKSHKVLYACYFLSSIIAYWVVIGECVGIALEYVRWQRLMRLFEGGLTEELLHRMDLTHDDEVCMLDACWSWCHVSLFYRKAGRRCHCTISRRCWS